MPVAVDMNHVNARFAQFVPKYSDAMRTLGYPEADVQENARKLGVRLAARDFKLYGDKPINVLHGGKRITRFLIKSAIEYGPAQRARRERLLADYNRRAAEIRAKSPDASFFSFEHVYAKQLKVPLMPFKPLFRI